MICFIYYLYRAASTIQDTTPLGQSCLGEFGGPIFPYLAVGGDGEVFNALFSFYNV